jgi:hypothetical protein
MSSASNEMAIDGSEDDAIKICSKFQKNLQQQKKSFFFSSFEQTTDRSFFASKTKAGQCM